MNKFLNFVEDANINNTQTYADFQSDSQRSQGFQSGNPASSIRVNTALRQANLVACALMDVCAPDDNTIDFRSTRASVANLINTKLASLGRTITLNGAINNAPTFYAPTTSGSIGQILKSKGVNHAPEYATLSSSDLSDKDNIPKFSNEIITGRSYSPESGKLLDFNDTLENLFDGYPDVVLTITYTLPDDIRHRFTCNGTANYDSDNNEISFRFPIMGCVSDESEDISGTSTQYEIILGKSPVEYRSMRIRLIKTVIYANTVTRTDISQYIDGAYMRILNRGIY